MYSIHMASGFYLPPVQTPFAGLMLEWLGRGLSKIEYLRDIKDHNTTDSLEDFFRYPLDRYFRGEAIDFNFELLPQGTPFQQKVWTTLQQVPYGFTITYQDLALHVGQPEAVRAIANACGANPLPIIIPCHRVVASDGLGGYTGGPEIKKWLLRLEGVDLT